MNTQDQAKMGDGRRIPRRSQGGGGSRLAVLFLALVVVGAGAKVLGAITVGSNTRIGAGSVLLRDVGPDSTVVGIPGRVIHQSGVRIDPLAHSALPDAEARVIRNLMERIDSLENDLARTQACLREVAAGRPLAEPCRGESQSLKDREILEFLGGDPGADSNPESEGPHA